MRPHRVKNDFAARTGGRIIEMNISDTQIRAYAENYTLPQLRDKLREAMEALAAGGVITQASTGSGTGYTRQIVMSPADAVELYQAAIDYKTGQGGSRVQVEHFTTGAPVC